MTRKMLIDLAKQGLRRCLPLDRFERHLFIVGAQKAGTSSLFSYLQGHPQIACGDVKEVGYFSKERLWRKGERYYRSVYQVDGKGRVAIDATPEYMYYEECAERIYRFSPEAMIVMLLREPVARAFSAYNMYQQISRQKWFARRVMNDAQPAVRDFFLPFIRGEKQPDIEYFLERELEIIRAGDGAVYKEPSLLRRGIYAPQIERFVRLFGRDRVFLLFSNDLKNSPAATVGRLLEFVGVEPMADRDYPMKHVRAYTTGQNGKRAIEERAGKAMFEHDKVRLQQEFGVVVPW